ncbi:MAG: acetyltransferase [Gemmatimonadales bacterium]
MSGRFLVWGAGGHGRVVADLLRILGHDVVGFADRRGGDGQFLTSGTGGRLPIVSEDEVGPGPLPLGATAVALGIGDNRVRLSNYERVKGHHACPGIVHPAAVLAPDVTPGDGAVVLAGAVVNVDAEIGAAAIVNTGSVIEHEVRLGLAVHVSPGAVVCGASELGDLVWIGAGATVIPKRRIGAGAVVGAGSVAIRDVPAGAVVAGCPARPLEGRPR